MVGGKVIETLDCGEKVWINCQGTGSEKNNKCAIYVERTAEARSISEGDSFWWQSGHAYWTPRNRAFSDKQLNRIGFSGVDRPVLV